MSARRQRTADERAFTQLLEAAGKERPQGFEYPSIKYLQGLVELACRKGVCLQVGPISICLPHSCSEGHA